MKIPLKIKIFMWFVKMGVILMKENLVQRNWKGSKTCCFCSKPKTIQHLCFESHYAKFLRRAVHIVFGLSPPQSTTDLFNGWSKYGNHNHNLMLFTGAASLCWAIWLTRNETVFDKCRPKTFLQVLFGGTHWLRFWPLLQHTDDRKDEIVKACQGLESRSIEFFPYHGWPFILCIGQ